MSCERDNAPSVRHAPRTDTQASLLADGVAKCYRIYSRPSDRLVEVFTRRWKGIRHRPFWALEPLSLAIEPGATWGIIGRNGSGKSTLLQMLAGTIHPTRGLITRRGRVVALLELGAGFNPEFTGRENAMLNGALLGLSTADMQQRLPAILDFAEIGDFIDQPVKTYSSGMFVRLAFATAMCVDPDVLIIDEALAVGDVGFQARCFDRLKQFQNSGKTIVFVSHDLNAIKMLCTHALLLDRGQEVCRGAPEPVVDRFLELLGTRRARPDTDCQPEVLQAEDGDRRVVRRCGNQQATIRDLRVTDDQGRETTVLRAGSKCRVSWTIDFHAPIETPVTGIGLRTMQGVGVYEHNTQWARRPIGPANRGDSVNVSFQLSLHVCRGPFVLTVGVSDVSTGEPAALDRQVGAAVLEVIGDREAYGIVDLDAEIELNHFYATAEASAA